MPRTEVTGSQIKDSTVDLAADVTGILPVSKGGSGADNLALNNVVLGNGTGAVQTVAPGNTGNVLTSNGSTWISQPASGAVSSVAGKTGVVTLTATDVAGVQPIADRGQANGYASLDANGQVPLAQWAYGTLIDGGTPDSNGQIFIDGGTL